MMLDQEVKAMTEVLFDAPVTVLHSDCDYWLGVGSVGACRVIALAGDASHLDALQAVSEPNELTVFVNCGSGGSTDMSPHAHAPCVYIALAWDSPVDTLTALDADFCIDAAQSAGLNAQIADVTCTDSAEAYSAARHFIQHTRPTSGAPVDRLSDQLLQCVSADAYTGYDMLAVLAILLDDPPSLLRNSEGHLLTGLAQIGGMPLALIASQPAFDGGRLQVSDCIAAQRQMHLAQRLQLPIVVLQDTQGLLAESGADIGEKNAGLNDAVVALLQTWREITVPVITVL
ncbi:MAG: hypothetical protein KJO55_03625, partial [Gammaproteobacteria bacterium]|nr:hypothetical protein [Gammaproteobacteria bacterium]